MYRDIVLGKENDDVNETIKFMRQKGIRRLPVIDDSGALVGIVTLDDLIDLIAEQLKDLAELIWQAAESGKEIPINLGFRIESER